MSKRQRTVKQAERTQLTFPAEIWFLIGNYVQWDDVETLRHFIRVSQSAIRFVQPSLRVLVHKLITNDKHTKEMAILMPEYFNDGYSVVQALRDCLPHYYSTTSATLTQWRDWSTIILSVIQLGELHKRYLIQKTMDRRYSYRTEKEYKYVSRISPGKRPSESTTLSKVFYLPKDDKPAIRIDRLHVARIVETKDISSLASMMDKARTAAKKKSVAERDFYLLALDKATATHCRALCYYLLADQLVVRAAKENDLFCNLLLVGDDTKLVHIYSTYNSFAHKFLDSCATYTGANKDAPIAFNLFINTTKHHRLCIEQCKLISLQASS